MDYFFAEPSWIQDGKIIIQGDDVKHITNVLRMKPGEELLIGNGIDTKYICKIIEMDKHQVVTEILEEDRTPSELPIKITLFQGLPKGDKMELVIQKAVELGAYEIVPVAMKNCVVKLDEKKAAAKVKRWQTIAESAAKQSKRMIVPEVKMPMTYRQALDYGKTLDYNLIPYENENGMDAAREKVNACRKYKHIGFYIGPEGGYDPSEIELADEAGFPRISLGKRILRTETAGLAVLSILMFAIEE